MNQVAVFVDAGYFWIQTSDVIYGRRTPRQHLKIDYAKLREEILSTVGRQFDSRPLLRVYWYDGPHANGGKAPDHRAIEDLDDFKLRLGTRNMQGNQKAVDGLIIADLIALAQSKAISAAIILSGDADLTPGVTSVQNLGIRVHLLSMGTPLATSPYLRAEVDCKVKWTDETVKNFATPASDVVNPPCQETSIAHEDMLVQVAQEIKNQHPEPQESAGIIPSEVDKKLLYLAKQRLGRTLDETEKRDLRTAFKRLASQAS